MVIKIEVVNLEDIVDRLEKFQEKFSAMIPTVVKKGVEETMMLEAKSLARKRTGTMSRSITWKQIGAISGAAAPTQVFVFGTNLYYAPYVEFGTSTRGEFNRPAYEIKPRHKKALWWKGLTHPIRRVKAHPGMTSRPFMRPAFDKHTTNLPKWIEQKLRENLYAIGKEGGKP